MVLCLLTDTVVVLVVMHSVFDMVDAEVWASAGCGMVLMGEWLALLRIF